LKIVAGNLQQLNGVMLAKTSLQRDKRAIWASWSKDDKGD